MPPRIPQVFHIPLVDPQSDLIRLNGCRESFLRSCARWDDACATWKNLEGDDSEIKEILVAWTRYRKPAEALLTNPGVRSARDMLVLLSDLERYTHELTVTSMRAEAWAADKQMLKPTSWRLIRMDFLD